MNARDTPHTTHMRRGAAHAAQPCPQKEFAAPCETMAPAGLTLLSHMAGDRPGVAPSLYSVVPDWAP
jgi:hypothetical protein